MNVTQQGITTGMSTIADKEFAIYPNPSGSILYFSSKAENVLISIFDVCGKLVLYKQVNGDQIDITNLKNGIYTMKIRNLKGLVTKKFIKE
jgi:hypothetical protein